MKTKNIIISIFSILTLISCKNESDKKEGDQNQAELKETFDVNFNLTISKTNNPLKKFIFAFRWIKILKYSF